MTEATAGKTPVLSAQNLVKHFPIRGGGVVRRTTGAVQAVSGVSFDIYPHETLALVGESGCGKSTTARVALALQPLTDGKVTYEGRDLATMSKRELQRLRRDMQIVFQDPYASVDPRLPVNEIIAEPLRIHGLYNDGGRQQVRDLMKTVGLRPEHGNRFPHEFSGGQRQRIGIARALALKPKVLVLDEPVSALDVSIQAGVLNLLKDLQAELGLSYLFVSHDLSVVRHVSDRIAVMYLGKIVETAPAEDLFTNPAHPYTQALISAIPVPDPRKERTRQRIVITGDVPSPANPPSGCRFRTRCPKFANELDDAGRKKCTTEEPLLLDHGQGHPTACHFAESLQLI
ncbi:ABC transporter ATP-binding protein [Amycolatopsis sp. FDAARGOS 1241]|uniref:ABC transporter ATP-binding protein n=1 Tax=Amycolatopsis sp. FDAARGOS 1241 TaxID=2778070 RepID=UPI00194E6A0F|nr:oligopeptide/dipeptide ABC transporter ATP-binding protein [Amycolatopsis sp. FDAARGOS 1241]QRP47252.1 ATP-binding cassette domain-containing protein [Amycolatopsis sp. FDAARGOS 1241]